MSQGTVNGTFGSCQYEGRFATKETKKLPKSFNYREPAILQIGCNIIKELGLTTFRVPTVYEHWVEGRRHHTKMDRILPPIDSEKITVCKFWGSFENYDECWKTTSIDSLCNLDLQQTAFELGVFHRAMMERGICIWEVEIMYGRLEGESNNSLFLLDFDKAGEIIFPEKKYCKVKGMTDIDVSRMLVQESYPRPGTVLFQNFVDGFKKWNGDAHYTTVDIERILDNIPKDD